MKSITMDMKKLNLWGVCLSCLNFNRKMYNCDKEKTVFQLIANIHIPDEIMIEVCWECKAYIDNIIRFKSIAEKSYQLLSELSENNDLLENLEYIRMQGQERLMTVSPEVINVPPQSKEALEDDYELVEDYLELVEDEDDISKSKIEPEYLEEYLNEETPESKMEVSNSSALDISLTTGSLPSTEDTNLEDKLLYICDYCFNTFDDESQLMNHTCTHRGEQLSSCKFYSYKSKSANVKKSMKTREKMYKVSDELKRMRHKNGILHCCSICVYKSNNRENLARHMRTHTGEKPFSCSLCRFKCSDSDNLKRHERIHEKVAAYSCTYCTYRCNFSANLKRHMRRHRGEKPFSCELCSYKSVDIESLRSHVVDEHTSEEPFYDKFRSYVDTVCSVLKSNIDGRAKDKSLRCILCLYKCDDKRDLIKHTLWHIKNTSPTSKEWFLSRGLQKDGSKSDMDTKEEHLEEDANEETPESNTELSNLIDEENENCEVPLTMEESQTTSIGSPLSMEDTDLAEDCNEKTNGETQSISRTHKVNRLFSCKLCSYKTKFITNIKKHATSHNAEKFSCKLCSFKSVNADHIKRHLRVHTNTPPYRCTFCSYMSKHAANVRRHMRTHTGERPFSCELCPYKSADQGNLSTHMNIHASVAPFCCPVCSHTSNFAENMKRHMRTHTGEKPYSCELCSNKYADVKALKKHLRSKKGHGQEEI